MFELEYADLAYHQRRSSDSREQINADLEDILAAHSATSTYQSPLRLPVLTSPRKPTCTTSSLQRYYNRESNLVLFGLAQYASLLEKSSKLMRFLNFSQRDTSLLRIFFVWIVTERSQEHKLMVLLHNLF